MYFVYIIIQRGEYMSDKNNKFIGMVRKLPIIICLAFVIIYFCSGAEISPETLAKYTPDNVPLAVLVIFLMYAIKSISVAFPLVIIQIAATLVLPTYIAFIINVIGIVIDISIPYNIGRFSGVDSVERLVKKHKRLEILLDKQQKNTFFLAFILHSIYFLPGNVTSMYFGATKASYLRYLIPSFFGMLPSVIMLTFLGINIKNAQTEMIALISGIIIAVSLIAMTVYYIYNRRIKKKQREITT